MPIPYQNHPCPFFTSLLHLSSPASPRSTRSRPLLRPRLPSPDLCSLPSSGSRYPPDLELPFEDEPPGAVYFVFNLPVGSHLTGVIELMKVFSFHLDLPGRGKVPNMYRWKPASDQVEYGTTASQTKHRQRHYQDPTKLSCRWLDQSTWLRDRSTSASAASAASRPWDRSSTSLHPLLSTTEHQSISDSP